MVNASPGLTQTSTVCSWLMNVVNDGKAPCPSWDTPHGRQVPVRTGSSGHLHWLPSGLFPSISLPALVLLVGLLGITPLAICSSFSARMALWLEKEVREVSLTPDGPLKAEESETMSHSPTECLD